MDWLDLLKLILYTHTHIYYIYFPDSSAGKESTCKAGDPGSISGLGRSARKGIDYPLQYSWASLSFTNSQSLLKLMCIELVMPSRCQLVIPSNILILCHPLLLLPSIFPSIRVFSNDSALRIRWPKYWSYSFNISPHYFILIIIYISW